MSLELATFPQSCPAHSFCRRWQCLLCKEYHASVALQEVLMRAPHPIQVLKPQGSCPSKTKGLPAAKGMS